LSLLIESKFFFPFFENKNRNGILRAEEHISQYCIMLIKIFLYQVNCDIVAIQNDDIANGVIELISLHGIKKLVVGAASDKKYSK